jgi:hypothetical protein
MTTMPTETPAHARPPQALSPVRISWVTLLGTGGISVTFNIVHAVAHGRMELGLAMLYGIAPVFSAMCLSHIVALHKGGRGMQVLTYLVMLGAMAMSIGAVASVVHPVAGPYLEWVMGAVLDAAALIALRVILTEHQRAAARAARAEADERARAEATRQAEAAAIAEATRRAELEAEREAAERAAAEAAERANAEAERVRAERAERARHKTAGHSMDADAVKARAEYRRSVKTGTPLSDRSLGAMFGRSRTWGANRIEEVTGGPKSVEQAAPLHLAAKSVVGG